MTINIVIDSSGFLEAETFFATFPDRASRALSLAINDTARDTLPKVREQIYAEVNYPAGYLDDPDRLSISQFASKDSLTATIKGRSRPTSLARFAPPATPVSRVRRTKKGAATPGGITVTVKPGEPKLMENTFLVPLNSGNIGFAIRLKPGEVLRNIREYHPIELSKDVFLLYGPSVDQVLQGVASDLEDEVASGMEAEFYRQFYRLQGNA